MDDARDDTKGGGYRRVEVLTGPGRRWKWPGDEKARIVSETLQPSTMVTEVARCWQVCPQQVFGWRHERRLGPSGGSVAAPDFVPIVSAVPTSAAEPAPLPRSPAPSIEVELSGAVLRIPAGIDAAMLTTVLRAIWASAA